jgi:4-hydroxyphenylacetate 3-monooxygenase
MFTTPGPAEWLDKFYSINDEWQSADRRRLLAFARDLLNSDYAGHRLTFQLFAQAPPFAHLNSVYRAFDFDGPLALVQQAAGLSDSVFTAPHRPAQFAAPQQGWAHR